MKLLFYYLRRLSLILTTCEIGTVVISWPVWVFEEWPAFRSMILFCAMKEVAIGDVVFVVERLCCEGVLSVLLLREGERRAIEDRMASWGSSHCLFFQLSVSHGLSLQLSITFDSACYIHLIEVVKFQIGSHALLLSIPAWWRSVALHCSLLL